MIIQEKSIPHIFRNKYLRDQGGAVMVGGSGGGTVTTVGGDYLPANLYESETYKVNYNTEFLKNLTVNGDINLTGKIYVNGEEFKGGEGGEAYLKNLKDVGYTEEPETPSNDTLLVYSSAYKSWLYKNGKTYIEDVLEDSSIITNIQIQIDGLKNTIQTLKEADYITYYPDARQYYYIGDKKYYHNSIVMPIKVYKSGIWGSQPDDDIYDHYYSAICEIEVLDYNYGLQVCYVVIKFRYSVQDANMSGHHYMQTVVQDVDVIGGNYDWNILSAPLKGDKGKYGEKYSLALDYSKTSIQRIRARALFYEGSNGISGLYGEPLNPADKKNKILEIYSTCVDKLDYNYKQDYKYPEFTIYKGPYTYNPPFLTNYQGEANIYGHSIFKSGHNTIDNDYMVYNGDSGLIPQYGVRLESIGGYSNQLLSYINVSGYYGIDMFGWGLNIEVTGGHKLYTDYHDGFLINGSKILTQNDIYSKKDIYTKEEVNTILGNYYSINSLYTKTEVNELLDNLEIDKYYKKEESDERYYTKEETESISEELVKENYGYYFKPVIQRVTNIESQLGDIEILLDKILGYEANEYLNETLDEIIG